MWLADLSMESQEILVKFYPVYIDNNLTALQFLIFHNPKEFSSLSPMDKFTINCNINIETDTLFVLFICNHLIWSTHNAPPNLNSWIRPSIMPYLEFKFNGPDFDNVWGK